MCIFPHSHSVSPRIQSEYGKIRTRKNSVFEYFSHSGCVISLDCVCRRSFPDMFFEKMFLEIPKIHRKTTVLKSVSKTHLQLYEKKRLRNKYFTLSFAKISRKTFFKEYLRCCFCVYTAHTV